MVESRGVHEHVLSAFGQVKYELPNVLSEPFDFVRCLFGAREFADEVGFPDHMGPITTMTMGWGAILLSEGGCHCRSFQIYVFHHFEGPSTRVVPRVWDDRYKASHVPAPVVTCSSARFCFPVELPLKVDPLVDSFSMSFPSIEVSGDGRLTLLIEPYRYTTPIK